jgi:hypothetical protein
MNSILHQVRPETAAMIEARATASGLSIDDYLKRLLGMTDGKQNVSERGLDELMTAIESLAEDNIEPLPQNFSREASTSPKDSERALAVSAMPQVPRLDRTSHGRDARATTIAALSARSRKQAIEAHCQWLVLRVFVSSW